MVAGPKLSRFEWACFGIVAAAFALRLTFILQPNVIWDSAWYLMLARSFGERGDFWLRWSDPAAPEYSGYWPPLFPVFVSPFVKVFGASYHVLVLGSVVASALLTTAVFFTTRDLYGRRHAWVAAALIAANPAFYVSDSKGMSESLLALTVVLTVWAFLRSLKDERWLPVAGAFALLAYLGKASLGLPFVAAGVLALGAWRVYTRGWKRVLTSRWDLGVAIAFLGAGFLLAATRTERIGGVGLGLIEPLARAVNGASCATIGVDLGGQLGLGRAIIPESWGSGFHCWLLLYPLKVAFVSVFLLVVTLPFSLRVIDAFRAPRNERTDALWLATLLPIFAGAIFTTSFYFTEGRNLIDFDNIRYLTPSMVPFLWLVLPRWPLPDPVPAGTKGEHLRRTHRIWFALAIGSYFALELLSPIAGLATYPRLRAFVLLSSIPLLLGLAAYFTQYEVAERRLASGEIEQRFVPISARKPDPRILIGSIVVLIGAAWLFSAWYVTVGLGLAIAITSRSERGRALAMVLVLLGSSASSLHSGLPLDEARDALAKLPEGTLVGLNEQIVFPAAVMPDNVQLRLIDPERPIPDDLDVLLLQQSAGLRDVPNFTRVAEWDYRFEVSPTMRVRIWIEENILGQVIEYQKVRGETLFVRTQSGLDALYPTA